MTTLQVTLALENTLRANMEHEGSPLISVPYSSEKEVVQVG